MKYSQEDACLVISMFENYLNMHITIENYHTEEFFHIFGIETIQIDGVVKTKVQFRDTLVGDCIAMRGSLPDIASYVNVCFK